MKKENVLNIIDKRIFNLYQIKKDSSFVKIELNKKSNEFVYKLKNENKDIDLVNLLLMDTDTIKDFRTRYIIYYIKQSLKRIRDIEWIENNRHKFNGKSDIEILNLIKLKELLEKNTVHVSS